MVSEILQVDEKSMGGYEDSDLEKNEDAAL